jgi:hypothetical protein
VAWFVFLCPYSCPPLLSLLLIPPHPFPSSSLPTQNAELFNLTYGAMVMQLIRDYEDVQAVNQQLEKMYV